MKKSPEMAAPTREEMLEWLDYALGYSDKWLEGDSIPTTIGAMVANGPSIFVPPPQTKADGATMYKAIRALIESAGASAEDRKEMADWFLMFRDNAEAYFKSLGGTPDKKSDEMAHKIYVFLSAPQPEVCDYCGKGGELIYADDGKLYHGACIADITMGRKPAPSPQAAPSAKDTTGADLSMTGATRHKQAPSELVDGPETQTLGHSSSPPLPKEVPSETVLPGAVEEAMKNIEYLLACARKSFNTDDAERALATIRAALEKRRVTLKEVREWAKTMTNAADHYKNLTSDQFFAIAEGNENYLRGILEAKGIEVKP